MPGWSASGTAPARSSATLCPADSCGRWEADEMEGQNASPGALHRLLRPRAIAVFGGKAAAAAIRQLRRIGYQGQIWPVHPRHDTVEGLRAYRSVAELPAAPDAAFLGINRELTIEVIAALAARGAGGAG